MNQYLGPAILVGAILFVLWRRKEQQKAAQRGQAQPVQPTVIYQAGPEKKLLDLHDEYHLDRAAEIRRERIKRSLDQQTLEHEALVKIGQLLTPPKTGDEPPKS